MKKSGKRLISLLLALIMILSVTPAAFAESGNNGKEKGKEGQSSGIVLETEEIDPSNLGIKKLGEEPEEEEPDPEEINVQPDMSLEEVVRVSIFLDGKSTIDAGYSTKGIAANKAAGAYRDALKAQQKSVTSAIEKAIGRGLEVKWNLTLLTNAVSAYVKVKEIPTIKKIPGVKSVERERRYEAAPMEPDTAEPNTANTSNYMTGAVQAWDSGYTGAGSRIAIIDTGIDTAHQSFDAEAFMQSINELGAADKLMTASDIPSGLNGAGIYVNSKIPFAYNYVDGNATKLDHEDGAGNHGSHVAGIAAANKYIKNGSSFELAAETVFAVGMAPDAQLILMKVFGESGGAYDSDYMVAIEDAIVLGCDAVNLSLGSGDPGWTYDGTYQDILNSLGDLNHNPDMVVTISAGNNSSMAENLETDLYIDDVGMYTGGSPGTFINSLGVAAADNTGAIGQSLMLNSKKLYINIASSKNSDGTINSGNLGFVYIDSIGDAEDLQSVNNAVSLRNKIMIVNRGTTTFVEKATNAATFSPNLIIIANNVYGTIGMSLDDYEGTVTVASIILSDANYIKDHSTSHTLGDLTYYTGSFDSFDSNITADNTIVREDAHVSGFSSWGIPGSLIMKPEIAAPGGNIYSVAGKSPAEDENITDHKSYVSYDGTSMAAPHVAGLAGVLAQYIKQNSITVEGYSRRAVMQSLLMSTATPMINDGEYVSVLQQGAGLIEVSKAISAASVVMVGADDDTLTARTGAAADGKVKAEFGDDPAREGIYEYSFTVYNTSDTVLDFTLSTELFTQGNYTEDGLTYMDQATTRINADATYVVEDVSYDVDKDGDTDLDDAAAILDYLTGNVDGADIDTDAADLDNDGKVTSYDAYQLIQTINGSGLTIAAGRSRKISVRIALTEAQKAELDEIYTSGAYIEGFTYVTCGTSTPEGESLAHEHSIPLLGFYGSWTDPSMFDNMSYVDGLYGAERESYSKNNDTNYLRLTYNGSPAKFVGNPYMVEDEFPADKLAVNSNSRFLTIHYNLLRSAGTTGFAVSAINELGGDVTDIAAASVVGNEVTGLWYDEHQGAWKNTGTKFYNIDRTPASYGFSAGDTFRIGFYAIPEYNGMLYNAALADGDMTDAYSGMLDQDGFESVILSNVLGRGAFIGYDFTVDDEAPTLEAPILSGNKLTLSARDDQNIAYIAVLSLDGQTVYAEQAPGTDSVTLSIDASEAIANARGYVAVFIGDYAGNETARAIRVNDNAYEEKTVYVLTTELAANNDYLIVNNNQAGSGVALGHSGTTIATNSVTIKPGDSTTGSKPYIESADVAETSVWSVATGYTLKNGNYYLGRSNRNLQISTSSSSWTWDGSNSRLSMSISNRSYYLRYSSSTFNLSTTTNSIYLYKKTVIRTEVDPTHVTGITIEPASLDLYKGNTADLYTKVSYITAEDRSVSWTSSNNSVATVDQNGHVTAVGAGNATITATSNSSPEVTATCSVKVTSVNKTLSGIIWDEEGEVYFSSFNANNLPTWTKNSSSIKINDSPLYLHSAFMQTSSNLYAGTLDTSSAETILYSVNRSTYAVTEYGENYLWASDMAIGASGSMYSSYIGFAYTFAYYLVAGPIAPEDDGEGGVYSGLPYAFLDCSETTGGAYFAGIACKSRTTSGGTYYVLDENGVIWQTTLSYDNTDGFVFSNLSKVVETGISTSFLYQSLYYDGTWLYWSHQTDNIAELIIINPSTGAVYNAGDFGEGVWPAAGLYVNGSVAPASTGNETMDAEDIQLEGLKPAISREELLTDEVMARFAAEAEKMSAKNGKAADSEASAEPVNAEADTAMTGSINRVRAASFSQTNSLSNAALRPRTGRVYEAEPETRDGSFTYAEVPYVEKDSTDTNGVADIEYDSSKLTFKGVTGTNNAAILSVNPAYAHDDSTHMTTIRIAYALDSAPAAGGIICVLEFDPCEDGDVIVRTLERGVVIDAPEPDQTVELIALHDHDWTDPVWSWTGYSSATATFTCAYDDTHTKVFEATITTSESGGNTIYTATVVINGTTYIDEKIAESDIVARFQNVAASFDGRIRLNFYVSMPDTSREDIYAVITVNDRTERIHASDAEFDSDKNGYRFSVDLYAKEIKDTVNIKLVDSNDVPVTFTNSSGTMDFTETGADYTVEQYVDYMIANGSTDSMKALARAAKDYCYAASNNFKGTMLELSSAVGEVTAQDLEGYKATREGELPGGVSIKGISALFESDNSFRFYLGFSGVDPMAFTYAIDGAPAELQITTDGQCYLTVTNVAASKLHVAHTYTVSDGATTFTMTASVLSYARSGITQGTTEAAKMLSKALYLYNRAAYAYFGDN